MLPYCPIWTCVRGAGKHAAARCPPMQVGVRRYQVKNEPEGQRSWQPVVK